MPLFEFERFKALLNRLNCNVKTENVWQDLQKAYQEPHRFYHTQQHIDECLQLFDRYQHLADKPLEVEFALWFHDVVYNTKALDNEEKSARWAKAILQQGGVENKVSQRIYNLILATEHKQTPQSNDEKLLVDIDLAILASTSERFAQYQQQIRKEYIWVPKELYQQKRCEILKNFYNRATLYYCAEIRTDLESQAQLNLSFLTTHIEQGIS